MSKALSPISLPVPRGTVPFPEAGLLARLPDWAVLEGEIARGLAAIRDCAGIAWWDGSSVGLRLNGMLGLFEASEPVPDIRPRSGRGGGRP